MIHWDPWCVNPVKTGCTPPTLGWRRAVVSVLLFWSLTVFAGTSMTNGPSNRERGCIYYQDKMPEIPWSIHVVKIDRSRPEFQLATVLGKGDTIGMGTVSEQIKTLSRDLGYPVAAINGDFYQKHPQAEGSPRDLQIRQGELVSSPSGHMCFWVDARGNYLMTNVQSHFRAIWADGKATAFALNQERGNDSAVLYTKAMGASTHTVGGMDLVLEYATNGAWLPLRIGQTYVARVRSIRNNGDAPLQSQTMVLSIGPKLLPRLPAIQVGDRVRIATETSPSLEGVQMAIGGGPALVLDGQAKPVNGIQIRNPRTAVGWSKSHLFLVEVDGRQSDLSVGMTLPELVAYMLKLGCEQAMNLDGGGSSTLWAYGNVMNSPSEGEERASANSLVVIRRKGLQK